MSIRALRSIISVHRHGSFRAAADAEFLTPAAISQQMRHLEVSWELELFDRTLRTPKFTSTGLALVTEAESVVSAYDNLADKVKSNNEMSGELILGAVPTTLTGLVPLALSQLEKIHPDIRVRISPSLTTQLLLQIDRGQIDAAIISKPDVLPQSIVFTELATERMVILVANTTKNLTPKDLLKSHPFIRFNRDAVVGRLIETWLQKNGIFVKDAMELEGLEAISSMVAAGLGISIVPQRCIAETDHLPLKMIQLGDNGPQRVLGLARRADTPKTKLILGTEAALLKAVSIGQFRPK
ncbi:LysR family transcriptional regulator [Rhodobacteraceae bacterium nBUS_24]